MRILEDVGRIFDAGEDLTVGIEEGRPPREAIALGVACGTAGATHLPPELPPDFDRAAWLPRIVVEVVAEA